MGDLKDGWYIAAKAPGARDEPGSAGPLASSQQPMKAMTTSTGSPTAQRRGQRYGATAPASPGCSVAARDHRSMARSSDRLRHTTRLLSSDRNRSRCRPAVEQRRQQPPARNCTATAASSEQHRQHRHHRRRRGPAMTRYQEAGQSERQVTTRATAASGTCFRRPAPTACG